MWWMSHPHVFPSAEYWLASRRGEKKAKQTQHIQILKKKKKSTTTFTKSTKSLTQIMLWRLLWNFLIFYSVPVRMWTLPLCIACGCFQVSSPSGTKRQIAGFQGGENALQYGFPQYFTWTVQAQGYQLYLILPTTGHQVLYMLSYWKCNTSC